MQQNKPPANFSATLNQLKVQDAYKFRHAFLARDQNSKPAYLFYSEQVDESLTRKVKRLGSMKALWKYVTLTNSLKYSFGLVQLVLGMYSKHD